MICGAWEEGYRNACPEPAQISSAVKHKSLHPSWAPRISPGLVFGPFWTQRSSDKDWGVLCPSGRQERGAGRHFWVLGKGSVSGQSSNINTLRAAFQEGVMRSHGRGKTGLSWLFLERVPALRYLGCVRVLESHSRACSSGDMAGSRECCPPKPIPAQVSFMSCHQAHLASSAKLPPPLPLHPGCAQKPVCFCLDLRTPNEVFFSHLCFLEQEEGWRERPQPE